jgi:hypothetical protein
MAAKRKKTTRKRVKLPTTRSRATQSKLNKAEFAMMRQAIPLGSIPLDIELPEHGWKPGDGATAEIVDLVLALLAGGLSLAGIQFRQRGCTYPSASTFHVWLGADSVLQERYAHAREMQADTIACQTELIAMGAHRDDATRHMRVAVERDKLHSEALRWHASKVSQRYSDRVFHGVDAASALGVAKSWADMKREQHDSSK